MLGLCLANARDPRFRSLVMLGLCLGRITDRRLGRLPWFGEKVSEILDLAVFQGLVYGGSRDSAEGLEALPKGGGGALPDHLPPALVDHIERIDHVLRHVGSGFDAEPGLQELLVHLLHRRGVTHIGPAELASWSKDPEDLVQEVWNVRVAV